MEEAGVNGGEQGGGELAVGMSAGGAASGDCQLLDSAVPMSVDPAPQLQVQQRLQTLVDAVNWVYASFWKLGDEQSSLVWADGCYRGAPVPGGNQDGNLLQLQTRREFMKQLQTVAFQDACEQQDLAARFQHFDLLPLEWFYLLSASFNFPIGIGTPGRAFSRGCSEWLCEADKVYSLQFTRADMAKAAGIKTLVCVPVNNGVVELGTTELLCEDPTLTTFVRELFDGRRMDMISQAAAALLLAATNNSSTTPVQPPSKQNLGPISPLDGPPPLPHSSAPLISPTTPPTGLRTGSASPSLQLGAPGSYGNSPRGGGSAMDISSMGPGLSPTASGGQMVRELLAMDERVTDLLEQRQMLSQLMAGNHLRVQNHSPKGDGRQTELEVRRRMLLSPLASVSGNAGQAGAPPAPPVDQEVRQRVNDLHQLQQEVEADLKDMSQEVALSPASLVDVMQQSLNQLQRGGSSNNILSQPSSAVAMRSSSPSLGMEGQWPKNLLGLNSAPPMNMFQPIQPSGNDGRRSSGRPVQPSDWNTWRQPPPPLMQLPASVQQRARNDNMLSQNIGNDIMMRLERMDPPAISPGALSMSIGGQSGSIQHQQIMGVHRNERAFIPQPLLSPDAGACLSLGRPSFNSLLPMTNNSRESADATQAALVDKIEQLLQDQPDGSSRLPALEDLLIPGPNDFMSRDTAGNGGGGGSNTGQDSMWTLTGMDFGLQEGKDDMSPIWAARATQTSLIQNRGGSMLITSDMNNSQSFPRSPSFGATPQTIMPQHKKPPRRAGHSSGPPSPAGRLPSPGGRDVSSAVPALSSRSSPSAAPGSPPFSSDDLSECAAAKTETASTSKRGWKEFFEQAENEREAEAEGGACDLGQGKKACTPPAVHTSGNSSRRPASSSGNGSSEGDVPQPPKDNVSHLMAERKRREKLNEKYSILRTLVPQVGPKADKLAVLGDTIKYVQELKTKATILRESYLEEKLAKLDEVTGQLSTPGTPGSQDASGLDSGDAPVDVTEPHIEVKKGIDEGQVLLIVRCKDRVGLFLDMMLTVHKLRLQVIQARVNTDSHSVKFGFVTKFNESETQTSMENIANALRYTCERPGWQPTTPPARIIPPPLPTTSVMPPPPRGITKRAPAPRAMKNT